MNDSACIISIWLVLIIWQHIDAPKHQKGFITAFVFSAVAIVLVSVVRTLAKRELLRYDFEIIAEC
jgi:ACS family pantothenate transporter-like MFS transporter